MNFEERMNITLDFTFNIFNVSYPSHETLTKDSDTAHLFT